MQMLDAVRPRDRASEFDVLNQARRLDEFMRKLRRELDHRPVFVLACAVPKWDIRGPIYRLNADVQRYSPVSRTRHPQPHPELLGPVHGVLAVENRLHGRHRVLDPTLPALLVRL